MKNKSTIEKYIEAAELPDFLRELADAIENGGDGEFSCAEDFVKFRVSAKNQFGKVKVRAKFKSASECGPPPELLEGVEIAPLNYGSLKKRMKSSFRMLTTMSHDGQLPPAEAMESFLTDAATMVTFEGYGDEYYGEFTEECARLKTAYDAGDMDAMKTSLVELAKQKGRCHAKYD
ncbi:GAK system XXXCH domain-containing protein [Pseudodesulfovibrio cashew]|uniref:GAK system XXXCH domain-containing protein n=1 Tax=Pseudodesulfovibrio cashew TaxID=2678688 RepID=A0A6I6JKS3_9BACT|nr:GAK system XXXCH domain-containing protein [Pseudodesulfovibrio cashew]QGY41590.1 GAK system XXXCH domain-containing protein [Pseudodesulfovibrio cashew]